MEAYLTTMTKKTPNNPVFYYDMKSFLFLLTILLTLKHFLIRYLLQKKNILISFYFLVFS